jgi:hypothetical protein
MSYIGSVPTTAAFPFDQFSGNGSTTAFTLTYAPASPTSIIVAISGVVQNPNLYSVIGTTITFSPAPPTGTNNISVLYLGLPVIGVSSPGNTAYRSSQDFTATASQTTFTTTGSYTVGFLEVYRNGVRLGDANFTATNGTTVVLSTACNAGDLVTIVFFTLVSVANAMPQSGGTFTGNIAVPTGTLYPLVSGTAVSASGTAVDFTGIPSGTKRVTVMFDGVSTSSTSGWLLQIGGASFETSGYVSTVTYTGTGSGGSSSTAGFIIVPASAGTASNICTGAVTITLLDPLTNDWVHQTVAGLTQSGTVYSVQGGGSKAITGALARVRVTTINGTDTFDAGSINIMWE